MNFMKEMKQRKERRFLKTLGKVGEILIQEVLLKLGSSLIKKIGGKKTLPSILFLFASLSLFAQYPATGNKQRLGYQTTGDGLVYRGRSSDTVAIKSSGLNNAYFILDTVNNIQYNYIKTKGGWVFSNGDTIIINNNFTQPVDSLFFNVNVPTNNVDTAKMRWDSDLATVVLGLNDNVPNEIGFKNFWLVKNQTGATITKGSIVYANGTVGASGRITVAKFIANSSIDAKYLLGITAHDLSNGEDGYVISFGKIRKVNTDTFAAGAILYPSPTVAGVWTDVEPIAPNIDMPIGFCINSHVNNGTIAIRVASGYKLSELHDVSITSPVDKASLYYRGGLWRDTTAALLTSDTASMLTNYLRTGTAASTYLPLTGGILTGGLTGTTGSFNTITGTTVWESGNLKIQPYTNYPSENFGIVFNSLSLNETMDFYWYGYSEQPRRAFRFMNGSTNSEKMRIEPHTGYVGINNTTPSFTLDVNGTLGVTGATTLSAPLTVNSSAVFNEGSAIADFRVESDNNANMLFVDGTNNRVGIGTNAPTRTLEVNGTVGVSSNVTANSFIKSGGTFFQFLKADGTVDGNDYLTTSSAGLTYYPNTGGTISGAVTLSTTTATPSTLLGKDGSNVVGTVTTVAQTGLMTRGETTATTGSPSAIFTVTHGLGFNPSSVIITSAGIGGGNKLLFEVYTKNSTTFSVQAWNLDGTEAASKSVKIYWLAIK